MRTITSNFGNSKTFTLLFVLSIFLLACGSGPSQEHETQGLATDFIQLTTSENDEQVSYPGTIEGTQNVDIKAQVSGYLETIFVKEGDYVKKGQPLFKIRSEVFSEQVSNSDAALKAAIANQATAQLEVDKIRPLVAGKVISPIQLQTAEAGLQAAKAQVAQARASLGSSKINAAFALITAPVSGFIGRIPSRIGNLVGPSDSSPLTTLSEINQVYVYFTMSEADYINYQKAKGHTDESRIELEMANGDIYSELGKLETASGNMDKNTGTMLMKAIFPNQQMLLRAGGSGRVILHHIMKNSISIPKGSVRDIQDKMFVFKLADSNKVKMVPLTIKGSTDSLYVVASGVAAGDQIAVNQIDALNDGTPVVPQVQKHR